MPLIPYNESDVDLLARLIRAEAEGEGRQGEELVGCVVVNRVFCDCLDFKQLRTVRDAVYQSPGGFEAVQYGYFYQRARESEKEIARKVLQGEWRWPARWALWYFRPVGACPPEWYNQPFVGQFKSHCFYEPSGDECPKTYSR
ncbi:cell wall hydrolase [Bacillus cereus]|nr:cell wall hydrolase [Bacillus cereus]EMA7401194.1 cell wall hydrolase [Bacillus cereus]